MKLFTIDENNEVKVNVPWIGLIPEFKELFRGSDRKVRFDNSKGKKLLAYIYFMLDFTSPLRDWNKEEKELESLRYTDLTKEDIKDPKVGVAFNLYEKLQLKACRPLKSHRSALKALDAMDEYLENVDFDARDKQGKLLYTPNQATANIGILNKAYDELAKLEKRIEIELQQHAGARGQAELGDKERMATGDNSSSQTEGDWNEDTPDASTSVNWVDMTDVLNKNSTNL